MWISFLAGILTGACIILLVIVLCKTPSESYLESENIYLKQMLKTLKNN